jgi:hypothetical protein
MASSNHGDIKTSSWPGLCGIAEGQKGEERGVWAGATLEVRGPYFLAALGEIMR